jgi:putative spermidine/putrescine transport system permease protein
MMNRRHRAVLALLAAPNLAMVGALLLGPLTILLGFAFCSRGQGLSCGNFPTLATLSGLVDPYTLTLLVRTFSYAIGVAVVTAVIGFPIAYTIARSGRLLGATILFLVVLPIMLSIVVRSYGWILVYGRNGLINSFLGLVGIEPVGWLHTPHGLFIAFVQLFLPYMVIPVLASLEKVERNLEHAAISLGASSTTVLFRVLLPLARTGLQSGFTLVFALCSSVLVASSLLGGARLRFLGNEIYEQLFVGNNLPFAAALTLALLTVSMLVVAMAGAAPARRARRAP